MDFRHLFQLQCHQQSEELLEQPMGTEVELHDFLPENPRALAAVIFTATPGEIQGRLAPGGSVAGES